MVVCCLWLNGCDLFTGGRFRLGSLSRLGLGSHRAGCLRPEISGVGELLVAIVEWADVWSVACSNPHLRAQVEVQAEPLRGLPTSPEGTSGE